MKKNVGVFRVCHVRSVLGTFCHVFFGYPGSTSQGLRSNEDLQDIVIPIGP